jgi:hypothetical protein
MSGGTRTYPDLALITLDALRYDVAAEALEKGQTPVLASLIGTWERRHTPGNFTYAAHAAFFAGFFPTPASGPGRVRPLALRFQGSRTIGPETLVLEGPNIVEGLRRLGYHTLCVGGVGFFNRRNPLGSVFPNMFDESCWEPAFSVSEPHSTRAQVREALRRIGRVPGGQPLFLFLNVSATHPPTRIYLAGAREDSRETQAAALAYVDRELPPLFDALHTRGRGGTAYLMSDHGTLFGEDGLRGHRVAHPLVWTVPYGEHHWKALP